MTKVSELLAKPIISIFDAKIIGTIGNIYFDSKMSKGLVLSVFNDEEDGAEEQFVELAKVVCLDSDAAVIRDSGYVTYGWNTLLGAINPINLPAFTQDGKLLGKVRDIVLDGSTIAFFMVDNREISASTLLSHSKNALVFNDSGKVIKPPPKKKIPKVDTNRKIELHYPPIKKPTLVPSVIDNIHNDSNPENSNTPPSKEEIVFFQEKPDNAIKKEPVKKEPVEEDIRGIEHTASVSEKDQTLAVENASNATIASDSDSKTENKTTEKENLESNISLPQRIPKSSTNVSRMPTRSQDVDNKFDFLIGKILEKNIYDTQGELLIRSNTIITTEVIAICKEHGRLVQLALHSCVAN